MYYDRKPRVSLDELLRPMGMGDVLTFLVVALPAWYRHFRLPDQHFLELSDQRMGHFAWGLLASLVLCHVIFR